MHEEVMTSLAWVTLYNIISFSPQQNELENVKSRTESQFRSSFLFLALKYEERHHDPV